jgi:glycosyltransferase involved in cell wall biosynthesis
MKSTDRRSRPIPAFASTAAPTAESVNATRREREMPRILMVCARYHPFTGGVETHVHETARRLASRGCRVGVLTTDTTEGLPQQEQIEGVSIVRVPAWPRWSDVRFAPGIYSEVVRGDWDLVHVQGYHTFVAPIAMAAAKRAGLPFVVTFHSGGHSSRLRNAIRRAQRLALRPLFRSASQLIGVSRYEADLFSRGFGVEREKFQVVPNGGDLPTPSPGATQLSNARLIVSIGRLERYKGHQRAIEAMPHVLRRLPDARLRIAGQGPYEPELRRLVARLRLDDRVDISAIPPGDRQAMADLLASAALVVLFSDYEAHPVAVMEALALRRKTIVSDTSGFAEMVEQGHVKGVSLDAKAEERARLMIETIESPWIPSPIELPTWEHCVDRLLAIYRKALTGQGAGMAASGRSELRRHRGNSPSACNTIDRTGGLPGTSS